MSHLQQSEEAATYPQLKGKIAIVTGAGSGIGRSTALKLAEQGASVCLFGHTEEKLEDVEEQIRQNGGEGFSVAVDVSSAENMQQAFQEVSHRYGRIDIVLANAGINGTLAPIEDLEPEDWDDTLGTNLRGTFLTVKHAIPLMKSAGGSIIITSSINGNRKFSSFGMSAYSSSKAAQTAFAKMAALELARYKIRVNVICPGAIDTNIGSSTHTTPQVDKIRIPVEYPEGSQPLEHGPGTPEQVADLVLFLAAPQSNHITGTEIYIDGAETLL
jgi:NAD(P)-dependent dehydrogenase (short-subunit alcohol dehydrogenase family)